jgi:iron(II)-dependent oxidoreductase
MDDLRLSLREDDLTKAMTTSIKQSTTSASGLIEALQEARQRTLELVSDLTDEQLMGPRLSIVNPLRWEVGHVAWFQEYWILRHLGGLQPILNHGDSLYDSARVAHDTRWDLDLPSRSETLDYMSQVLDRVCDLTDNRKREPIDGYDEKYFLHLVLFHEQMHAEAITYTRQTLCYPAPRLLISERSSARGGIAPLSGDAHIPGGAYALDASPGAIFQFDNEHQSHTIEVAPFSMSKKAVTNAEVAGFVEDGGYRRRELWSDEGWQWRRDVGAEHPVYWQRESGGRWLRRDFDKWMPLEGRVAVIHVNWYEADAYCRWAGRRLPTEAEWEMAASCEPSVDGRSISNQKRRYPWGDDAPTPERANLDWRRMGCIEADTLPAGDSAFGCRQMIGNVWEWTATTFEGYPGFVPGPYKEYSEPWFGDHKVLRGGCWATRSQMIRSAYRNFYTPDRRDVWAGFRTCAP